MERFDKLTKSMQKLVGVEVFSYVKKPKESAQKEYISGSTYGEVQMNCQTDDWATEIFFSRLNSRRISFSSLMSLLKISRNATAN